VSVYFQAVVDILEGQRTVVLHCRCVKNSDLAVTKHLPSGCDYACGVGHHLAYQLGVFLVTDVACCIVLPSLEHVDNGEGPGRGLAVHVHAYMPILYQLDEFTWCEVDNMFTCLDVMQRDLLMVQVGWLYDIIGLCVRVRLHDCAHEIHTYLWVTLDCRIVQQFND